MIREDDTEKLARYEDQGLGTIEQRLIKFIDSFVDDAGAEGVVVNLSGGLDSTVTARLAVEALGSQRVHGLILPADATTTENTRDARHVAEELAIDTEVIPIQSIIDEISMALDAHHGEYSRSTIQPNPSISGDQSEFQQAIGNVAARTRMQIAYFRTNTTSRLVIGTGNKTELLLGYFTKYGDGGVDFLPLGDLYKTDVRALAEQLDVREKIIEKQPTAGLWEGQTDHSELGAPYETIDTILSHLVDGGDSVRSVATRLEVPETLVAEVEKRYERTAHKRNVPPVPSEYFSQVT